MYSSLVNAVALEIIGINQTTGMHEEHLTDKFKFKLHVEKKARVPNIGLNCGSFFFFLMRIKNIFPLIKITLQKRNYEFVELN